MLVLGCLASSVACSSGELHTSEGFGRQLAREISENGHSLDESAVLSRVNTILAPVGDLGDEQRREVFDYACKAKDRYDLSQVGSVDEAAQWVSGQSQVPVVKARALLRDLAELPEHPTPGNATSLSVDTVCAAASTLGR